MKELKFLLCLGVLGLLALACSGPEDTGGEDFVDVFGIHIPDEIIDSFRSIPGGTLDKIGERAGTAEETTAGLYSSDAAQGYLTTQEALLGLTRTIDGFAIMDSEVTVQMYTDFLNRVISHEGTNSGTTSDYGIDSAKTLYRGNMASSIYCGIIAQDSLGTTINVTYLEYSGTTSGNANTLSLPLNIFKPSAHFVNPNQDYQKPLSATSTDSIAKFKALSDRRNYPAVFVSQYEAKQFCKWLGPNYRLPTWDEWMYAAKGGRSSVNFATDTGDIINSTSNEYLANIQGFYTQASGTTPVKYYSSNPYGLYDMTGNVFEWTYFRQEDETSATIPNGGYRFLMGGSYATPSFVLSSVWCLLNGELEDAWAPDIGFRVVYDKYRSLAIGGQFEP